jgi:hypothetical protein
MYQLTRTQGLLPPFFRANFVWYKKIDDFSPIFGWENDPNQIWKKKILILHENKFMHN